MKAEVKKSARERFRSKTERAYAEILEKQRLAGDIISWSAETVKFRIGSRGHRCWYTPDFRVVNKAGEVEFHEIKGGYIRDDARVKFLAAARIYNEHKWRMIKKDRFGWSVVEEVLPRPIFGKTGI